MSQRYHANANLTYSTLFLGINFTFLYWTYPSPVEVPNATTSVVFDPPYTAYFTIDFKDGTKENLSFYVSEYPMMMPFDVPHGVKTVHSSPRAGIVISYSWGLWDGWQYTVALLG
jgi:hypothetical protein